MAQNNFIKGCRVGISSFSHDAHRFIRRVFGKPWVKRSVIILLGFIILVTIIPAGWCLCYVYFDRTNLPDPQALIRFNLPTVGHVYDVHGQPLIEMASEYRQIITYQEIPPIVRDAVLAAEDKNFFSHSGIDYSGFARVLFTLRIKNLLHRMTRIGQRNAVNTAAIFPQGGSTITQQLIRGFYLKTMTEQENSTQLHHNQFWSGTLSNLIGARTVNMLFRKIEEIRLSIWIEDELTRRLGSKRRAKEEILARYASLMYMGNGQYGLNRGAEYYFDRPLTAFTPADADKAALLAGTIKSPRYYAPNATDTDRVLKSRNQILALMQAHGFISLECKTEAAVRPIEAVKQHADVITGMSAVADNVLQDLKNIRPDLTENDLMEGRLQVYSTVNVRIQKISNRALEEGLSMYEKRHPRARGVIQGSVVVLRNSDASILAESGGREYYKKRYSTYSDFNRVTESLRQPGSTMKPIVYLAAFRDGAFNLNSEIPDEPISVLDGEEEDIKWISNYDGQYKGNVSIRRALAESRNAATIWIANQIGISSILKTAGTLGIQTRLRPFVSTALGASEVNLMELANAYRSIASGILAEPFIIRKFVFNTSTVVTDSARKVSPINCSDEALSLIQEGLRGVVRMPDGTAHSLSSRSFPVEVMGKTGTTNEFRDALFVGSTYGTDGITVAVRIGFDDNSSLGVNETGGRLALPVFKEIMSSVYGEKVLPPPPRFPAEMETRITDYLKNDYMKTDTLNLVQFNKISTN